MRTLEDESLTSPVYRYPGVTSIADVQGLARRLDVDEADL